VTEDQSGAEEVPNNPAGRVLSFLRSCENPRKRPRDSTERRAETIIAGILDVEPGSADMHLQLAHLRIQAESVPALLAPYATELNLGSFFRGYQLIIDVIKDFQSQPYKSMFELLYDVTPSAWSALEEANRVLSQHSSEVPVSPELETAYVDQVRALIDQVADDDTLSPADRSRIVDLLRKVEQALLEIKINGTVPVQEAAAAAAAVVRLSPSLWERVKSRPWVRDFATVLFGIFMLLEATANTLAIEQYVSDEPQKVIVVPQQNGQDPQDQPDQQDQQGGQDHQDRQEQSTDKPTPR
jgi:hypothetical protein